MVGLPRLPKATAAIPAPFQQVGLLLRAWSRKVADRPFPPDLLVFELSMGFATSAMMSAVVRHGIADAIRDRAVTAAEIADELDLDADAVHRLLRCLATYDLVHLDRRGRFRLTRVGSLLRTDRPDSMAPWLEYLDSDATAQAWRAVDSSLRDGGSAFLHRHGVSVWEWLSESRDEGDTFAAAMARMTDIELPSVVSGYPWPKSGVICDIAGGTGTLLAEILKRRRGATGVLIDRADQLSAAAKRFHQAGLADRVEMRSEDMFQVVDVAADTYVLKDVLHDWDDEASLQVLRTVRACAPEGSTVVVIEQLQPANVALFPTSLVDMHMLTQTDGGRQRSASDLHELLRQAEFEPGPIYPAVTYSMVSAVARA